VEAVSVKDVAARAGVSVGTVSHVLNHPDRVKSATRTKVEAAIATLGYVRNESARQLRLGSSRTLAYLAIDTSNPFFTDVARGAEDVARTEGLALFLCNSDGDPARESDYLDLLLEQRVRGVLVTAIDYTNPRLRAFHRRHVPVVLVDRAALTADEFCGVGVDDLEGGELAGAHLIEQGHEIIGFAGGPVALQQVRDRLDGARRAVETAGLARDSIVTFPTPGLTVDAGRRVAQRLLGLPRSRRPSALFCANDLIALGALQSLTQRGVAVPDEVALVGYDDIDFAAAAAVPLSSVSQPRLQLGRTAAEMLLGEERARGESHVHEQVTFRPELVVRDSSATPRVPRKQRAGLKARL
jgi:LacI family transcriptional regulator